jgi:hypothetical protein
MRVADLLLPVFVAAAVGGSFMAGRYVGTYDTEKRYSELRRLLSDGNSVDTLFWANAAIQKLQEARLAEAQTILVRYAKLQVPGAVDCSKLPLCATLAGPRLPNSEQLQTVMSRQEPANSGASRPTVQ